MAILNYQNPHLARFMPGIHTGIKYAFQFAAQTIRVGDVGQAAVLEVCVHERMRRIVDSSMAAGEKWEKFSRIG